MPSFRHFLQRPSYPARADLPDIGRCSLAGLDRSALKRIYQPFSEPSELHPYLKKLLVFPFKLCSNFGIGCLSLLHLQDLQGAEKYISRMGDHCIGDCQKTGIVKICMCCHDCSCLLFLRLCRETTTVSLLLAGGKLYMQER